MKFGYAIEKMMHISSSTDNKTKIRNSVFCNELVVWKRSDKLEKYSEVVLN